MKNIGADNIRLEPLHVDNIELLRIWRNTNEVRSKMLFQDYISTSDQIKWFNNLDDTQHYYEIYFKSLLIGFTHVKNINWSKKVGEAGILLGNKDFIDSHIPIIAILMMMNHYFYNYTFNELHAKVRKDNTAALELNLSLGYQIKKEYSKYLLLHINSKKHFKQNSRFNSLLTKVT
jgi:RimJ/RimL family protein N-acetyltransferase